MHNRPGADERARRIFTRNGQLRVETFERVLRLRVRATRRLRVELITVGKELLIGRTLNTNAHWIGGRLARIGTMVREITTVDDDLAEISAALKSSLARTPEFLVVVGGLGPTPDDMTLVGVARGLGRRMVSNKRAHELMMQHYAERGLGDIEITPARRKMATFPDGAEPLKNGVGTAPGARLEAGNTVIFCLPGVPSEMRWTFARSVEPEVRQKLGIYYRRSIIMHLEGVLESALAPVIGDLARAHPGAYIKSHPRRAREGVSKVELDIVLIGKEPRGLERELEKIASDFVGRVREEGGRVISTRGRQRSSGMI